MLSLPDPSRILKVFKKWVLLNCQGNMVVCAHSMNICALYCRTQMKAGFIDQDFDWLVMFEGDMR